MHVVVFMRGLPGSGKSTAARTLAEMHPGAVIVSADDYFGSSPEEYKRNWSKDKLPAAHAAAQQALKQALESGAPYIIVDNVNATAKDMLPYYTIARRHNYKVRFEEPPTELWKQVAYWLKNKEAFRTELDKAATKLAEIQEKTHGVPKEAILSMIERWEPSLSVHDLERIYRQQATESKAQEAE